MSFEPHKNNDFNICMLSGTTTVIIFFLPKYTSNYSSWKAESEGSSKLAFDIWLDSLKPDKPKNS